MPLVADLLKDLEQTPVLTAAQMQEVRGVLAARCADPAALLKELVRRGWLSEFQARMIQKGQAGQLVLGPYLILDVLGKGGMGQIFKARHTRKNLLVALKVLHKELAGDPAAVQRFYREIEVASQVLHPNIVRAYEAGPMGAALVLAMEYVQGINLEALVERAGRLPVARACALIRQAAEGLAHAHERGLVHRDLKPSNLLVDAAGVVKILDLGLARLREYVAGSQTHDLTLRESKSMMQGTPDYMAPEQALDFHQADTRSDIYSLGCTLFFLLAGKPPFAGGTLAEKLMKHQQVEPPVAGLAIPAGLAAVLRKMLAKQPADRYQKPGEVVAALAPFSGKEASLGGTQPGRSEPTRDMRLHATRRLSLAAARRAWQRLSPKARRWLLAGSGGLGLLLLLVYLLPGGSSLVQPRAGPERRAAATTSPGPGAAPTSQGLPAGKVASFAESFHGPTPAPGWQYLWNPKGPVGNPAHYAPLLWDGKEVYDVDGQPGQPGPDPGAFVFLGQAGGHPGRGKQQGGEDRAAIAAYTIQPGDGPGQYWLVRSSLGRGNGLRVIVHVNAQPPRLDRKVPANRDPPAAFDTPLGTLKPGDTVYVAIGPDELDHSDSFDRFDFTIYRGMPPEAERPLVPRSTRNPFEYPDILHEVAPGFSVDQVGGGGLALLAEHQGRRRVVQTHPLSEEVACVLSQRLRIPAGRKTVLVLDVSHHPQGDWQLIVNAAGQTLLAQSIGKNTVKDGWAHFEVSLTPFAGREITLEIYNAASGWNHEWAYWSKVAVESR